MIGLSSLRTSALSQNGIRWDTGIPVIHTGIPVIHSVHYHAVQKGAARQGIPLDENAVSSNGTSMLVNGLISLNLFCQDGGFL